MKLIAKLSDYITEEISDAKKYAKCALRLKDEKPELSQMFATLAQEELGHMNRLHSAVVGVIAEYRDKNGDPPPVMQALYDREHEKQIDAATEVHLLLAQFKG
jgi:ferritin